MKKTTAVALSALVLVVGLLGAGAQAKRSARTVEVTYAAPAAAFKTEEYYTSACIAGAEPRIGCVDIPVAVGERTAKIELKDATGLPVPFLITQKTYDEAQVFCGSTGKIKIIPGRSIHVLIYPAMGPRPAGDQEEVCAGIGTSGTVVATFK